MATISSISENAVVVEFGREISVELNDQAIGLARHLEGHPFSGFAEAVPAYASTAVYFDPLEVRKGFGGGSPITAVRQRIEEILATSFKAVRAPRRTVEIPVDMCGEDLTSLAKTKGLDIAKVVEIFVSKTYRVFMLGFLPGFAYMGEVDERIAVPRKETPRKAVPKGSVGIAGRQTGIYPLESPGGWQIIGRTQMDMFSANEDDPCLLRPGDEVLFVAKG